MIRILALPLIALAVASAAPSPAAAQQLPIQREIRVSPGQLLDLDLDAGGDVQIVGSNRSTVRVRVEEGRRGCNPECRVDVQDTGRGVRVHSYFVDSDRRSQSSNLRVSVEVPNRFDVRVHTTGGEVDIDNVSGKITGRTMGGKLELRRLGGRLDLSTMGGAIRLADSRVDGKVHTMGGEVLMENVQGGVEGSTMGGKVVRRGAGAPTPSAAAAGRQGERGPVRVHTMGGDIQLADAPGGANVNTMGGDIHIGRASGPVRANTMGGTIRLDAVDGGIVATTMGGDVRARMVGNPAAGERDVEIRSMGGDIELIVPAGLSMELDVELAFTRDREGDYRIISDFPLQTRTTPEWDYDRGNDPRKVIHGTGSVAGGRNKVRIRTINGNVRLVRGEG